MTSSSHHHKHDSYSVDVYVAYAKSMAIAIERRVLENPPRRPADFWRICVNEMDNARWRMRTVANKAQGPRRKKRDTTLMGGSPVS